MERYHKIKKVQELKTNLAMNETQAVLFGHNHNNSTMMNINNTTVTNSNNSTFDVEERTFTSKAAAVDDKENVEAEQHDDTYTLQTLDKGDEDDNLNKTVALSPTICVNASRTKRKTVLDSNNSNSDQVEEVRQQSSRKKKSRTESEKEIEESSPEEGDAETTISSERKSRATKDNRKSKDKKLSGVHHSMVLPGEMKNADVGTPLRPRRNPRRSSTAN